MEKGRSCLFDKLVDEFSIDEIITVDCCIEVLRNTYCDKCLFAYPWFYKFLNKAGKDFKLKIITNGNIQQQKNKIQSLIFPNNNNKYFLLDFYSKNELNKLLYFLGNKA